MILEKYIGSNVRGPMVGRTAHESECAKEMGLRATKEISKHNAIAVMFGELNMKRKTRVWAA